MEELTFIQELSPLLIPNISLRLWNGVIAFEEADESLNFDEMILEAAKSIAAATSALVKAASSAQRELIDNGKVSRRPLTSSDDGQWSEGLISAARLVAAATHSLVESANSLVQGVSSEEKLVSSAKQVASSTAQLLVACKVKADPDSDNTKRLQAAGNAVKRATDNLVRAAQQAIQQEEERSLVLNRRMVGGIAQEINARSEVLRIERELEEARSRLTAIRQAKYKKGENSPSDGEQDGFDSFNSSKFESSFETSAHQQLNSSQMSALHDSINVNDSLQSRRSLNSHQLNSSLESSEPSRMYVSSVESRSKVYPLPTAILESKAYPLTSLDSLDRSPTSKLSSSLVQQASSFSDTHNGTSSHSLEQKMLKQTFTSTQTTTTKSYRINED